MSEDTKPRADVQGWRITRLVRGMSDGSFLELLYAKGDWALALAGYRPLALGIPNASSEQASAHASGAAVDAWRDGRLLIGGPVVTELEALRLRARIMLNGTPHTLSDIMRRAAHGDPRSVAIRDAVLASKVHVERVELLTAKYGRWPDTWIYVTQPADPYDAWYFRNTLADWWPGPGGFAVVRGDEAKPLDASRCRREPGEALPSEEL